MKLYVEDGNDGVPFVTWEDDVTIITLSNILSTTRHVWNLTEDDRKEKLICSHLLYEKEILNCLEVCGVKVILVPMSGTTRYDFFESVERLKKNENIH